MPFEIIVPRLGWSMEQGNFVAWLKKDGEFVKSSEPLFSIEGDKAIQEIESIDSGILRILSNGPKPGDSIRVGDVLGHLVSADEAAPVKPETITIKSASRESGTESDSNKCEKATHHPAQRTRRRTISPRAFRIASEMGVDWTTVVGTGRTGRIRERDIRATAAAPRIIRTAATGAKTIVLVTGACGFIGTWVVRDLLQRGCAVVALDVGERPARWERVIGSASAEVPLIQGSLLNRDLLPSIFETHRVTHVIHLAALLTPACQADPFEACSVNVLGSVALFEEVRKIGIQGLSYASSVAVFGEESDHADGTLTRSREPVTFYGAFKKSVELIAAQYWRQFKIASVGIRPQVAYGPERDVGMSAGPSLAARAAAAGEPFCITYIGRVGYDYVEDVARAFVRGALETPPGAHVVDLPGEVADVPEVIAAIGAAVPGADLKLSASGPSIPAHAPLNPLFISTLYPDWKTTSLAEGMRRTVEFYRRAAQELTR
jgi:UDP-glucose 4-epimerase